ncbi:MAG: hypothetical protein JXR19_10915 [Bacteroidia bacterium]
MKNLIITLVLSVLYLFSAAQADEMEIIWGEPYQSKKSVVTDIISSDDGEIFAIKRNLGLFNQDIFIERYNNLEPSISTEIKFDQKERFDVMKNIIKLGQDLWMLNFKTNYDEASLDAHFVDKQTLNPMGEVVPIFDLSIERRLRYSYGGFDYVISRDEMKIAFVTQYPGDRDEATALGVQVHDQRFDLLWENELTLPYERQYVELSSIDVSKQGKLFCLLKVYESKEIKGVRKNKSFDYHLISVDANGNQTDELIALETGERIQNLHFEVSENEEVIIAGFFGTGCCTMEGTFFMKLDNNNQLMSSSTENFAYEFVSEGMTDNQKERLSREANNGKSMGLDKVDFREFIMREDGSVVLIGEMFAFQMTPKNAAGDQYPIHFNYKDIVVVSIDPEGRIEWSKKILKRQLTTEDGGFMSSFVLAVNGDKLHFIYNDHKDNLNIETEKDLNTYNRKRNNSVVAMVSLDRDGNQTKEHLIEQKELGLEIRPQSCQQISANELILFGMNKSENLLARLIF